MRSLDDLLAGASVNESEKSGPDEASVRQNDLEPDYPKSLARFAYSWADLPVT